MSQVIQQEIEQNYEFFRYYVPEIVDDHRGEYALLHDKQCIGLFGSLLAAVAEATNRYKDGRYSIQEVTDTPVDLGFFSMAVGQVRLDAGLSI